MSASKARQVALAFTELGHADPSVIALLSSSLLEPACESAIAAATREAAALVAEREAVGTLVQNDALTTDPAELDEIADTIEAAGAFTRIFSGRYKAAWRRASRLCADATNPSQAASYLRRTASFIRARRLFHDESRVRSLFPAILWNGLDSDFTSLGAAQALVAKAALQLAVLDEASVLRVWLTQDETERQSFSACCDRLFTLLAEVPNAGLAEVALRDLLETCSAKVIKLRAIVEASEAIRLRPEAHFKRTDGRTIADAVVHLHAAKDAFCSLGQLPLFGWVGDVTASLSSLADPP